MKMEENPTGSCFNAVRKSLLTAAALIAASALAQTKPAAPNKDSDITRLPAFEVNDTTDSGYFAREALSGNKTKQALENLAGAYSVVTRDLLNDLGQLTAAPEAVKFVVPGITPFVHGDQYMIRGRRSGGTVDDGVPSVIFFADSVGIDSIEMMKGPQAVLYGQQAGMFGNVLRVSKKPLPVFQGRVAAYYGSNDYYRTEIDVTGPMPEGFSYRVTGAFQDAKSHLTNYFDKRKVGIASLQWRNAKTTVRLVFEHQDLVQRTDNNEMGAPGTVFNLWRGAGAGSGYAPPWGYYEDVGNMTRLVVSHEFNPNLQSRISFSRAKTFRDYVYLLGPVPDWNKNSFTQDYFNYAEDYTREGVIWDNLGKFRIKDVLFQTNFGYSWDKFTPQNYTRNFIPKAFTGVLNAPDYSKFAEPRTSEGATGTVLGAISTATSAYVLETVDVLPNKLILSAGTAYNKSVVKSQTTGAITTDQGDYVKRLGAVFKPVPNISLYAGWATMFNPSSVTTLDINGNPMPIITGKGTEVGVKTTWLDGKLAVSVDYYKLKRTNISVFTGKTNSRGLGYYELVGDEDSKGWEFEAHVQMSKNWQLTAVAWKGDSLDRTGAQFFNSLKESAGFFTRYNFEPGSQLSGFAIGGGSYAQGRRYYGAEAAAGFFTHNVFASYKFKEYNVSLNIDNITDKSYIAGGWSHLTVSGSVPRSFRLTLEKRFR